MSDSLALARLLFARSRNQLIGWTAWLIVSLGIAVSVGWVIENSYVMPTLTILTFPMLIWSLAMFEFGNSKPNSGCGTTYSHWLLRMPIADWTLAYVPLAMRFVWITCVYLTLVLTAGLSTNIWPPIATGLIVFYAGGAWMSTIAWRPFRGMWRRVGITLLACIVYYFLLASVMTAHFDAKTDFDYLRDHPILVKSFVAVVALIALVSGCWMAKSSLSLARINSDGLIAETPTKFTGWVGRINTYLSPDASKPISHRSGRAALAWHDLRRLMLRGERWVMFFMLVGTVLAMSVLPIPIVNALFVMFLFCQLGVLSGSSVLEPTQRNGSSLPTYIAASPLTCAQIGFTRGFTGVWTSYVGVALLGIGYAVCLLMPYNQRAFWAWSDQMTEAYQNPNAAFRWMALVVLIAIAMVPSRSLGFVWPTMSGRSRLSIVALSLPIFSLIACLAIVIAWFLKQARGTWETTIENAWYWTTWIPTVLAVLLLIKFVATIVAATQTLRCKLIKPATAIMITAVWLLTTIVLALAAQALIPDQRVLFAWVLMVTALLLPLGRILVLPYAVYLNRYR